MTQPDTEPIPQITGHRECCASSYSFLLIEGIGLCIHLLSLIRTAICALRLMIEGGRPVNCANKRATRERHVTSPGWLDASYELLVDAS